MTKNPFEKFFTDLADELDKAFDAASGPEEETTETNESPVKEPTTAPEAPEKEIDELSVEGLSLEAIRILKKAENTHYVDEAEQLIRIADRYIRLTELAVHANINL